MHAIELLTKELNITKYELAKRSGISTGTLNNMVYRDVKVDDIKIGMMIKLANGSGLILDEVYAKLKHLEKTSK